MAADTIVRIARVDRIERGRHGCVDACAGGGFLAGRLGLDGEHQGLVLPGAGPVNRAMGGASTALPIEIGGSYWNPALIGTFDRNQALLGSELMIPSTHIQTSLPAGAINGTFPPQNRYGQVRSDSGVTPNLATGLSFKLKDDSPYTVGMLIAGFVGGNVNYNGSYTAPLLTPRQPPAYFGVGPIYSNASMLAIMPMVSRQFGERLFVGAGPVVTTLTQSLDPAFFAPGPKDAFGLTTFPAATHGRTYWGGGFQFGLLYEVDEAWNVGFSYKSPVWQERWSYNSSTPDLQPRRIALDAQIPAIYSWGVAYKGIERLLVDVDFRYFDYANADLFGTKIADGGLNWRSVFAVATGAKYQLNDRVALLAGYIYNQNPIRDQTTLFNVQLPAIVTNTLSLGVTMALTEDISMTAGWVHGFRNSVEGGVIQIPGGSTRFDTQYDSILAGINVQFGGGCPKCRRHHRDHNHDDDEDEPVIE